MSLYETNTCESRYASRRAKWTERHRVLPGLRHHAWWLAHNVVAHPLLGVRPSPSAIWLHDWTSKHLNQRARFVHSPAPEIRDRRAWLLHNTVGHVLIGLFPVEAAFRFHDRTAEAMNVPDWV